MRYVIRGNNLKVTDALREHTRKKLGRLGKYFDGEKPRANVVLSVVKDQHRVEVTIPAPGLLVRAEESSEDMYASVDLVVEKLERQIRKYKTRINRKPRQDAFRQFRESFPDAVSLRDPADDEEGDVKIVRTKRFSLKPMDAEEAAMQMELLGHNFFVFTNAATEQINVIYKRRDGKFGLIEPE
ncbi:ribosome hibernation-promoting factor, HPF/YfiA family [Staphylospora marina]|uniref:ribosome hibernation-promoting factor, HPF/YfiA family n=1 Tax=Staphylospora marina TaxID=2490858 RepID=UPI000F5B9896|nr:ribosome-associated translation inhibitor RaiA [Staphylospora marina]